MSLLDVRFEGQPRVNQLIQAISGALDPTEILDEATASVLYKTRRRFLDQMSPDGVPWIPSQAALDRAKSGRGGGTLFESGRMFHSIQLFASDEFSRTIGTDVPYAKFHQFGTVHLPIREFLGFGDDDITDVTKIVIMRVQEALNGFAG